MSLPHSSTITARNSAASKGKPTARRGFHPTQDSRQQSRHNRYRRPQISNRCGDGGAGKNMIVPDVNRAIDSLKAKRPSPIVITLGDLICDVFVADGYGYTLDLFNKDFKVNARSTTRWATTTTTRSRQGIIPGLSNWLYQRPVVAIHSTVEALTSSLSTIWYIRKERP